MKIFFEENNIYQDAIKLLKENEVDLSKNVKETIKFFVENNIWYILSRNPIVKSCKEAANKRYRLGHIGIPLEDELKSYLGKYENENKETKYVIFHCKANQILDFDKIKKILKIKNEIEKLSEEELFENFSMKYGIVNPFLLINNKNIIQFFDKYLYYSKVSITPYTMMTNAGDFTWAIEFKIKDVIKNIDNCIYNEIIITDDDINDLEFTPKIGIITGNAPESGISLWSRINRIFREKLEENFCGDVSLPKIIVDSLPEMGMTMELDKRNEDSWIAIKKSIENFISQGVTIIGIACNTSQYFTEKIREISDKNNVKYISIQDCVINYLNKNNINDFAFLGIRFVSPFNEWSAFKKLQYYNIEKIPDEILEKIVKLAYKVKTEGVNQTGLQQLSNLINKNIQSKHIIIALTEISLLFEFNKKIQKSNNIYIDTLNLYAESISDEYLLQLKINKSYDYSSTKNYE